ncbi:MAG: hypothetical protein EXQ55_10200 [Acidobacteria bacterium]|nr:hypothetical protein [Acidobacteriota bacterium]
MDEQFAAIDEAADAVITLARTRADEVLAAAQAKTDRKLATSPPTAQVSTIIEKERRIEDQAVREERADGDEAVRHERAEHADLLSIERQETDKDLLSERARSDDMLATRDEFLAIVSHDLRNLLQAMVGRAQLIADSVSRKNHVDDVVMHAQRIQRSGGRMNRLLLETKDVTELDRMILNISSGMVVNP